jgi:hypothetical protein
VSFHNHSRFGAVLLRFGTRNGTKTDHGRTNGGAVRCISPEESDAGQRASGGPGTAEGKSNDVLDAERRI